MFDIQTVKEGVNIKIYRDMKIPIYLVCASSMFFLLPAFAIKDKLELLTVAGILIAGSGFACFMIWYVMHGAIILNKTRRQVEFCKDLGLQTSQADYRIDDIIQVLIKKFVAGGGQSMYTSYKIILELKKSSAQLELFFSNAANCNQAAKSIAEFAQVPAWDSNGKQIFSPSR